MKRIRNFLDDINGNPVKYRRVFDHVANLKILNYLVDCNKMDSVPYKTEYVLIEHLDSEWHGNYHLSRGTVSTDRKKISIWRKKCSVEEDHQTACH